MEGVAMGHAMIWIEALAAGLLLVGAVAALASRIPRGRIRVALVVAALLAPLVPAIAATALAAALEFHLRISPSRFGYTLSWTLAFAIAGIIVARRGLRRGADPAAGWPAGRLSIALGAAAALLVMTFWNLDLAMRQQLVGLRAEASAIALASFPGRVPDAENAAFGYRKAFEALREPHDVLAGELDLQQLLWGDTRQLDSADEETLAKLEAFARAQGPIFAMLRQAAALPRCDFGRDPAGRLLGDAATEILGMRRTCDALVIDALVKTREQKLEEVLDDIGLLLRMGEHLREDPSIISLLVSVRLDGTAIHALGRIIGREGLDPATLAAIPFGEVDVYRRALRQALRMEKAFCLQAFAETEQWSPLAPWVAPLYRVYLLPHDLGILRRRIEEAIDLAPPPYHRVREAWGDAIGPGATRGGLLTSMILPSLFNTSREVARAEARREVARAAIAVVRYRAERGSAPQGLADLVPDLLPAVPQDPFDGAPLRMLTRDGAVILYSIGPDLADGGGMLGEQDDEVDDIGMRIE